MAIAFVSLAASWALSVQLLRQQGDVRFGVSRSKAPRLALLFGAVAVPVLVHAYLNRRSGFAWDDIVNFRQAQVEGLSLEHLLKPTSGHLAPGHRFGDWAFHTLFSFNFSAAEAVLLAGFALSLVVFHRVVAELCGPGPGPIVLTLAYGAANVHVGVTIWWASGLDRIPATILTFVAILAYLRFFRGRSRKSLALSVAAFACSLLFYVKPVFVPLYLVLLRVLVLETGRPLRSTLASALREWRVWALYAVPAAIYGFFYAQAYPTELNASPSLESFLSYFSNLWFRVLVPGFFGVFIPLGSDSSLGTVMVIATQFAFGAGLLWTLRRWPGSWRAWLFFAATALPNAIIIGLTRPGAETPRQIAYTVYYNTEIIFLFFMALGVLWLRFRPNSAGNSHRIEPPPKVARLRPLFVIGIAAYVAVAISGSNALAHDIHMRAPAMARVYTDTLRAGLENLESSGQQFAVVDSSVPEFVVPRILAPYNGHRQIIPLIHDDEVFDPAGRQVFAVAGDGTLHPASLSRRLGGPPEALKNVNSLAVGPASPRFDERGTCITTGEINSAFQFRLPEPVTGETYAMLRYSAEDQVDVSLVPQSFDGRSFLPQPFRVLRLEPGRNRAGVFQLHSQSLDLLSIVVGTESEFCLQWIEVGTLSPR